MSDEPLAPIVYEYALACSAEHAFDVYTGRIGEWWDPRYTANAETLEDVTIDPAVGGRVVARHSDLGEVEWGRVTDWRPGRRLVHTFTLAQDPEHPSEVTVEFAPVSAGGAEGSTMRFAHGGWTRENAAERQRFSEWPVLLERFVALAAQ